MVEPGNASYDLKATKDRDPYEDYEAMRAEGPMRWDTSISAWVATSYEICRHIFINDKIEFKHPDGVSGGDYHKMSNGLRHPKTLDGQDHSRLHIWLLKRFSPRETSQLKVNLISDVIREAIDGFALKGKVDLTAEFAERIPLRVISVVLDMPWQDDEFIDKVRVGLDRVQLFYNHRLDGSDALTGDTRDAVDSLKELLMPIVRERRSGTGQDVVSQLWRDGPSLLENWDENDVYVNLQGLFLGGYDTTTTAISNACHLLIHNPELLKTVSEGDDEVIKRFVEEALRMLPPVQYRARIVAQDMDMGGVALKKGDSVAPLLASANRDEAKFPCPHMVDLQRRNPYDHLAFITGPRACIGAGLARVEVGEAVRQLTRRLPDLRADPDAPASEYHGLTVRRYQPVHAIFTPETPNNG